MLLYNRQFKWGNPNRRIKKTLKYSTFTLPTLRSLLQSFKATDPVARNFETLGSLTMMVFGCDFIQLIADLWPLLQTVPSLSPMSQIRTHFHPFDLQLVGMTMDTHLHIQTLGEIVRSQIKNCAVRGQASRVSFQELVRTSMNASVKFLLCTMCK